MTVGLLGPLGKVVDFGLALAPGVFIVHAVELAAALFLEHALLSLWTERLLAAIAEGFRIGTKLAIGLVTAVRIEPGVASAKL